MLGKLLKYEFRATGRIFLPFFGGLLFVSIISRLLGEFTGNGYGGGAAYYIGMALTIILVIGVAVITFMLMLQRFRKNLIGDEGYLMFTLPVGVDSLIMSKLIVSAVWYIASTAVAIISILIMSLYDLIELAEQLGNFLSMVFTSGAAQALAAVLTALTVLVLVFVNVLGFYMAISLAMIFTRLRGLIAGGIYIAYVTIVQIIGVVGLNTLRSLGGFRWLGDMSAAAASNLVMLFFLIVALIWAGALYFVTRFMLKNKLNLE